MSKVSKYFKLVPKFSIKNNRLFKVIFPATFFSHFLKMPKLPFISSNGMLLTVIICCEITVGTFVIVNHYENTGEKAEEKMG